MLGDGEPVASSETKSLALQQGISKNTLDRAAAELGVQKRKTPGAKHTGWEWWLPVDNFPNPIPLDVGKLNLEDGNFPNPVPEELGNLSLDDDNFPNPIPTDLGKLSIERLKDDKIPNPTPEDVGILNPESSLSTYLSSPAVCPSPCHSEAAAEESPPVGCERTRRDPSVRFRGQASRVAVEPDNEALTEY